MRVVVQRVSHAAVTVDGKVVGRIGRGLLVYLGAAADDTESDAAYIADKIVNLRIFADDADKMNLSVTDVRGSMLIVSQFTLLGDCRKGRRPGFDAAGEPQRAEQLYRRTCELVAASGIEVATGVFAAKMQVESVNDGPVTFLLDSRKNF